MSMGRLQIRIQNQRVVEETFAKTYKLVCTYIFTDDVRSTREGSIFTGILKIGGGGVVSIAESVLKWMSQVNANRKSKAALHAQAL